MQLDLEDELKRLERAIADAKCQEISHQATQQTCEDENELSTVKISNISTLLTLLSGAETSAQTSPDILFLALSAMGFQRASCALPVRDDQFQNPNTENAANVQYVLNLYKDEPKDWYHWAFVLHKATHDAPGNLQISGALAIQVRTTQTDTGKRYSLFIGIDNRQDIVKRIVDTVGTAKPNSSCASINTE